MIFGFAAVAIFLPIGNGANRLSFGFRFSLSPVVCIDS